MTDRAAKTSEVVAAYVDWTVHLQCLVEDTAVLPPDLRQWIMDQADWRAKAIQQGVDLVGSRVELPKGASVPEFSGDRWLMEPMRRSSPGIKPSGGALANFSA